MAISHSCFVFVIITAFLLYAVKGCDPPYCDNVDCGSCGNACCNLMFMIPDSTSHDVAEALNNTLKDGGPGGLYEARPLQQGATGVVSIKNHAGPVDYIGQAFHTSRIEQYVDTIDFTIESDPGNYVAGEWEYDTVLKASSISQVGGAYCDEGQNYNNIMTLVTALGFDFKVKHTDDSCPPPPPI
eukprot:CAMPEP_0113935866 /NCGR_PEP_ID=MMETSP1339-20121228/2913_1 /TAXON_ID=94617 /ORGANISM="Fibrocapsa japonica" /LENGTH=184 /DNA_ID=CAMNT_0000938153 /DNA_START=48 /DNA_END=602 /DNA_ORIENTATION=+ /assembly_acc=CAM_ASM_000762